MKNQKQQAGFSYIDTMIAITILMVGVLALVAAVTASVINSRSGEQQLIAKQYAASTLEAIFSARDIGNLGWDAVGNVGSNPVGGVNQGVFVVARHQIKIDDGPDNIPGTADDTGTDVGGFDRKITITDICDTDRPSPTCSPSGTFPIMLRKVEVSVFYQVIGGWREEKSTTIITNSLIDQ
jgi:type II secretory pathway pseudopilin PulG